MEWSERLLSYLCREFDNLHRGEELLLNGKTIVNLEMQVVNYMDWPEQSLSYLCREFDNLHRGEEYSEALKVIDEQKAENAKLKLEIQQLKGQLENK